MIIEFRRPKVLMFLVAPISAMAPRAHVQSQAPVLLCPDILMEILNHLEPGRRTPQEKKPTRERRAATRGALLASALTCRTLLDPALDALWKALDDAQPLLRLLAVHNRPLVSVLPWLTHY